jgi:peptide/nickel transport system substrate-binding protein
MNRRQALGYGLPLLSLSACRSRALLPRDDDRTLSIAIPNDPAGIEPGSNLAEVIGSEIILNIFDTLVAWSSDAQPRLEPRLATGWNVSPDGLSWRFTLRPFVRFHDDTPLDAGAVRHALERGIAMNSYFRATMAPLRAITTPDAATVLFRLDRPVLYFPALLAQPQAAIVSPAAERARGADFARAPIGTGPFRFLAQEPDVSLTLGANPAYFRGRPWLDRLVYQVIAAPSTRRMMLEQGEIDLCHQAGQLAALSVEDVNALRRNPALRVIETPSQILRQLEFNNRLTTGPTSDLRVRQAIAHAVDAGGLATRILGGTVDRAYGPLPTANWAFDPAQQARAPAHDPARAQALLAQAGYAPGQIALDLITFTGTLWTTVATFLQANLAEVGIRVAIEQMEFPALRARHTQGRFALALDGRSPWFNDPDAHLSIGYLSSLATSAMTFRMPPDAALDGLILDAQSAPSPDRRRALYARLQAELSARVPAVYLFSNKVIAFASARVQNLRVGSTPPLTQYWQVRKA